MHLMKRKREAQDPRATETQRLNIKSMVGRKQFYLEKEGLNDRGDHLLTVFAKTRHKGGYASPVGKKERAPARRALKNEKSERSGKQGADRNTWWDACSKAVRRQRGNDEETSNLSFDRDEKKTGSQESQASFTNTGGENETRRRVRSPEYNKWGHQAVK